MRGRLSLAVILLCASSGAAATESPICADRPSKSTGPCTVPQGKWQIETGLVDWSHDASGGTRTDAVQWANSAVKYGISDRADIELWLTPIETLSIHSAHADEHHSSFGDTLLRVKYRVTAQDAPVQVALDPFVKLPTANHQLGNGEVEGGLLVPISVSLGKSPLTLSLGPEIDILSDADRRGRHAATQQVVNLALQANDRLSLSAELWAMRDWDPSGTVKQTSADVAAAYLVNKDVQLDAGANFGLSHETADVELYAGVSVRF
jgi:hypothetical protein